MINDTHAEIEKSRAKLLNAIASASDITFIRSYGNIGDHLIFAGTRRLLSGVRYKEESIRNLSGAGGDLALISGGGAWCGPYHNTPKYLPMVEKKFRRVIVLPSSFDVSVESVREALAKTRALVFARERVSYEQIRGLCQADLAHDCAFFFDFDPYRQTGAGLLNAYRTDIEAVPRNLPAGNNDVSSTCESLDEWLWTISRHEVIKTDRAHVMIAAAMMGKQVFYRSSCYHKLPAIAEFALRSLPVARVEEPDTEQVREKLRLQAEKSLALLPKDFLARRSEVEITIVMLSYHRLDQTINAIRALKENVAIPFKLFLIDNNSGPDAQRELREICAQYDFIELVLLDENLGCVGGRDYAMKRVQTPYVMFIDNDIEVFPGAVEHLLRCLETNPQAMAATGRVIFPDGSMHLCGGGYWIEDGVLGCELFGFGSEFEDWEGESGQCQWVPGCLTLFRSEALIDHPYDLGMRNYYEDLEWCYRINKSGAGAFHRVVESVALHFHERKDLDLSLPIEERRKSVMKYIETMAHFHKIHELVIPDIFKYVPELGPPTSPLSRSSARLFLTMVNSHGTEWALEKWNSGQLAPLFSASLIEQDEEKAREGHRGRIADLERSMQEIYQSRHWKLLDRYWRLRKSIFKLFGKSKSLLAPFLFALGGSFGSLLDLIRGNG
ncbi:MAG: polysaccharide pyruvyl transferase family protein [Blastocatellales bacterium]